MKRILFVFAALLLIGVQLLPSFVVSASAADVSYSDQFINILDISTPNNSNVYNVNFSAGNNWVTFNLPYSINWNYIDILISYDGGPIDSAVCYSDPLYQSSESVSLTTQILSDGYVRIYGTGPSRPYHSITFLFWARSSSKVIFERFDASSSILSRFAVSGVHELVYGSNTSSKTFNTSVSGVNNSFSSVTAASGINNYYWFIRPTNWQAYDFLDFSLFFEESTCTSVSIQYGKTSVPFEMSYLNADVTSASSNGLVNLRIDLTGLDKSKATIDEFFIVVSGQFISGNAFSLSMLDGSYSLFSQNVSPLFLMLHSILDQLKVNAASTGQGAIIKDQSQQQAGQISDAVADFGSYEKPSSSDLNSELQFTDIIAPEALSGSTSFLTALFNVPTLMSIVTLSLMLALLATIVFGKR